MQLAHQARTQASSRYPSYKRRLGTGCDSANFPSQTQYGKRRPTENGPFLKAWEQIAFSERKLKFQVVFSFIVLWSKELTRAPVVQKVESAIHRIKRYPRDSAIGFPNTYPLDSDLSARGGGVLPYITYIGMCRPTGSWFWSSWFGMGHPFQMRFLERGILFRTHESSSFVSSHLELFKDRLLLKTWFSALTSKLLYSLQLRTEYKKLAHF